MNDDSSSIDKSSALPKRAKEQFPVDTDVLTNVRIYVDDILGDFLRIVVMNNLSTSQCNAYTEYYHGNSTLSIESVDAFTLRAGSMAGTQQHIDEFVGSMALHRTIPQPCTWCRGIYIPTGARKRLYQATDPDDSTRSIGLLIEQDSAGEITQISWYKTTDASAVFRQAPGALDFTLVRDRSGAPSLDPNDIGGWAWYYTTSLGACS